MAEAGAWPIRVAPAFDQVVIATHTSSYTAVHLPSHSHRHGGLVKRATISLRAGTTLEKAWINQILFAPSTIQRLRFVTSA